MNNNRKKVSAQCGRLSNKLIMLLLLILNLAQVTQAKNSDITNNSNTSIENAILVHINEYRQKHGLRALKMDARISREARGHSIDMAKHTMPFGHKYFLSRVNRLHSQIKNSGAGAENVAYNYKDAQDVVKNWLRSPGHKRNIDGNYDLTGIGIARDGKGKLYFTQIFLRTGTKQYAARKPFPSLFNASIFKRG